MEKVINLNGGPTAMYHTIKRAGADKWNLTGWMHPETKAEVGDSFQIMINGVDQILTIDQIEYTNHPGIFGRYHQKVLVNDDNSERTIFIDDEPEHPFKKNTRFIAAATFKEVVIKPKQTA